MDEIRDPQYKTPDGSALRIWRDAAKNPFLSEREGRAIFDEVVYVEVISPGSRDSTPTFEVIRNFAPEAKQKEPLYGTKYEEYKSYIESFEKDEKTDGSMSGTPLSEWKEMTKTMVASLKAHNVYTVDALANLPDTKLGVVGPDGRTWREKAKAYLEDAKGSAHATKLAADLENTRTELEDSKRQVKELAQQVQKLQQQQAREGTETPEKSEHDRALDQYKEADRSGSAESVAKSAAAEDALAPAAKTPPDII